MKEDGRLNLGSIGAVFPVEENGEEMWSKYWDDISGKPLDEEGMVKARNEEIQGIKEFECIERYQLGRSQLE